MDKKHLRRLLRERRLQMTDSEVAAFATCFAQQLESLNLCVDGVLGYYPVRQEADCRIYMESVLEKGGRVALPAVTEDGKEMIAVWVKSLKQDLVPGYKEIPEPDLNRCTRVDLSHLSVVLIPGLGFDSHGNRLGQGGGHYDRFLQQLPSHCRKIALAYDWQVLDSRESACFIEKLPVEPHDVQVDTIVTPTRLITSLSEME